MYHIRNKKTHYEAGFDYGNRLKNHNFFLLDVVPFELNEERIKFSLSCETHYQKFYPEILQEIKGLAKGQGASYELFLAILLSMYCIMPDQKCTNLCFQGKDGVFLGRNSDFLVELEKYTMNCIYKLKGFYSFNANTTAFIEMEDGMNEHGFAIGLTSIYPKIMKPGINAGMIVRYLLENCKTVKEALQWLKKIPIASSQTFAMADCSGEYVVVECNCDKVEIITPKKNNFVVSTNAFHSDAMKQYNVVQEDDWRQEERYQDTRKMLLKTKDDYNLDLMKEILSGKHGFICQYDRKKGADTVWSTIYDVKNKKIYRAEGNPSRKQFKEDNRR